MKKLDTFIHYGFAMAMGALAGVSFFIGCQILIPPFIYALNNYLQGG